MKRILCGIGVLLLSGGTPAAEPKADFNRAEEIVGGRCFLCHGMEGESTSPLFPRLAGQHRAYLAKQLADFQSGRRKSETMAAQVSELSPADMSALGAFFESRKALPHAFEDGDLIGVGRYIFRQGNPYSGVPACASCHGPKGLGTESLPRLASQHPLYLENQLKQFNQRQRANDNAVMLSIASRLTELEIKAVAAYLGSLD